MSKYWANSGGLFYINRVVSGCLFCKSGSGLSLDLKFLVRQAVHLKTQQPEASHFYLNPSDTHVTL